MKVITRAVYQMTDTIGEYIKLEEQSYEYAGPIAEAKGKSKSKVKIPSEMKQLASLLADNATLAKNLGLDQLNWAEAQQGDQQAMLDRVLGIQETIGNMSLEDAQMWRDRYQTEFKPIEDQLIQDAKDYASQWRKDAEAGRAGADVSQAFAAERENARRRLEDYGVDPSQTRAKALDFTMSANEAMAKAGAQNQARRDVQAQGDKYREQAINLGQATASRADQASAAAFNQAAAQQATQNQGLAGIQNLQQGAITPYLTLSNQAASGGSAAMSPGVTTKQQSNGLWDVGMTALGGWAASGFAGLADGGAIALPDYKESGEYDEARGYADIGTKDGEVEGPGGPRDDLIDAKLSDGEYVIPADIVERKGTEFFDKVIAQARKGMGRGIPVGKAMVTQPPGAEAPPAVIPQGGPPVPMQQMPQGALPLACGGHVKVRR
jgi:hypothetical protein